VNVSAIFIKRPVMATLLMAAFLIAGVFGYSSLPVSELPNVDLPTISVNATLAGANAQTMASSVATPLEKQFSLIAGVDTITSVNVSGSTSINIQFRLDRNIDAAFQDVQAALSAAARQLPPAMTTPPSIRKSNPADDGIFYLSVSSETLPLYVVDQYAENLLVGKLSSLNGVAQAVIYGQARPAVRIQVDPTELATRGIGIDEVANAIRNTNVNLPTGQFDGATRGAVIYADGQLNKAADYAKQIIAYRNGAPVAFGDVAKVVDSVENPRLFGSWKQVPSVTLEIHRQPGANTIAVVDEIKAVLPDLIAQLPPSIKVQTYMDRSMTIRSSVRDVQATLIFAAVLVVVVIFLFLRTLSATFIPSIALPISVIGTFAGMSALGYSLDNLSLMALTLCVGFVVDDAIVMLENIMRHVEMGMAPYQASLKGSKEVAFTIPSMTISLAAVFIPVVFMGGIIGKLLHEFAVTIVIAVLISGVVSMTLTPMLCSRMIKSAKDEHAKRHNRFYRASENAFLAVQKGYERSLNWSMRHRVFIVFLFFLSMGATVELFRVMPQDFLPAEDSGRINAYTDGANGISFAEMRRHQSAAEDILSTDRNIEGFQSTVGSGGVRGGANSGSFGIQLKPRGERELSTDQVIAELRQKFQQIPGINVVMQNRPPIRLGAFTSRSLYQYTMQDIDLKELYASSQKLVAALQKDPLLIDVNSDLDLSTPSVNVEIDRERAASLGITANQIEVALGAAFGGQDVTPIYTSADQYWVVLELLPEFQRDLDSLSRLYLATSRAESLTGNTGSLVPLLSVVNVTRGTQPLSVNHLGQLAAVTLSFNLPPGVALGDAVNEIEKVKRDLEIPASLQGSFQGTAKAFQETMGGMTFLLIGGILTVYIVLGMLYESFIHPLTILSGLPSACAGALLTLWLFHYSLSLYAFVGIIMLVGLVKKNAIMMIDFALARQRNEGAHPQTAIVEAAAIRFRPIMMTSMAALFGTLPIAVGMGASGEGRKPLGIAVVGGLLVSQALTLYITPVLYVYLDRFSAFLGRRHRAVRVQAE
jgi:HAE1 family hydrophobic/amphiphilic exporter-1